MVTADDEVLSWARLEALTNERRPVFVNLTAAWCLTCLVNEHTTLDSAAVRHAFAEHRIVALKGDWTRQDPEITRYLQKFSRSGVPLYLLYDRSGTPNVLPQILTQGEVLEADIFLNSSFSWSVANGGDAGRQDVESIALHELGHLHGLGHSMLGETELIGGGRRVIGAEAIMFPIAFASGSVNRELPEPRMRDNTLGLRICASYPARRP